MAKKVNNIATDFERLKTVLVVEQDEATRKSAVFLLQLRNVNVLSAGSVKEAMLIWQEHRDEVDLILTDQFIQEDDAGKKMLEIMWLDRPNLRAILTCVNEIKDDPWMEKHQVDFVPKPFPRNYLLHKVEWMLKQAHTVNTA